MKALSHISLNKLKNSYDSSNFFESQKDIVVEENNKQCKLQKIKHRRRSVAINAIQSIEPINLRRESVIDISKENICRICLDSEDTNDTENPLINPCKCSGSMKHIHLKCLQLWIRDKRAKRIQNNTRSYNWK